MAHKVKCFYCQETFDRDKIEHIKVSERRYAHLECALEAEKNPKEEKPKAKTAHNVKCFYCQKTFDLNTNEYVQVSARRYAHKDCAENKEKILTQEEKDRENLNNYIMTLFSLDYIDPRIQKQINQYIKDFHYTYSGIHKSLLYFYEIKKNPIDKSNGGIGIVPYVYQQAYRYYYSLWEAQQKNEYKVIQEYVPKVKEIVIPVPQRKVKKRKMFSFLDEEIKDGE